MNLGEELRKLRMDAGLSQSQLAKNSGVSQPYITQLETGTRKQVAADVLFRLAAALSVDCSHFAPFFEGTVSADTVEKPKGKKRKKK